MDPIHVIIIAAVVSVVGALATRLIERRTLSTLGIPNDTEKRIIDLREELIHDLEAANASCEKALAEEKALRERLAIRVDDLEAQNLRLLNRHLMAPGD
jgi:glutamine synthetase type III